MSTYTHVVTQIVNSLPAECDGDARTAVTAALVNAEAQMQQHFTGKGPKKQRKHRDRDPDAPKKTNWQAVWTSNANGCREYDAFKPQLEALTAANPTMGRFEINKQLKEWANENGQYAAWQDWARARLVEQGKPVPVDKAPVAAEEGAEQATEGAAVPAVAPTVPKAAPKPRGKKSAATAAPVAAVSN